jgi:hypothetical protein
MCDLDFVLAKKVPLETPKTWKYLKKICGKEFPKE